MVYQKDNSLRISEKRSIAGQNLPVHLHREDIYSLVLQGEATLRDGYSGQELGLTEGDILAAPAGTVVSGMGRAHIITVAVPASFCPRRDWRRRGCRRVRNERVAAELLDLYDWLAHQPGRPQARIERLLRFLKTDSEVEESEWTGHEVSKDQQLRLNDVLDRLDADFSRRIPLEELARQTGWHPHHLQKLFRFRYGMSPRHYQRQLRMETAARLLEEGQSGTDVAHKLGYADQSHFIRSFRRYHGLTPGDFVSQRHAQSNSSSRRCSRRRGHSPQTRRL